MKIHVAYNKIDTVLELISTHPRPKEYLRTIQGQRVKNQRFIVYTTDKRDKILLQKEDLLNELKEHDLDVNIEETGRFVSYTKQITVNQSYEPVYSYVTYDVLTKPNGERIERPHQKALGNINSKIPVIITDKLHDPRELLMNYIFRKHYYLTHSDGVTFKFLFDIAQKLFQSKKMAEVDTFNPETKKREPLVLVDGGRKFPRAFIEGIVKGNSYCLILHLSDQELELPKRLIEEPEEEKDDIT